MKTILVPVDFSTTSVNAAEYAVGLAKDIPDSKVILYHVYSFITLSTLTDKLHAASGHEESTRKKVTDAELESLKQKLTGAGDLDISTDSDEGTFIECTSDFILSNHVDLVVMGITGSSRISQVFMGTNTLNVIRRVNTPVLIVPPNAKYTGFKNVLFTSDFKDVARTTPFPALKRILDLFKPKLNILNVDSEHYIELTDEYKKEREIMEDKLGSYNPEFSFLRAYDFLDGINSFSSAEDIDAIITVPRKHSFLSQLFKTSHTKKLAYHSHVPIFAIPC